MRHRILLLIIGLFLSLSIVSCGPSDELGSSLHSELVWINHDAVKPLEGNASQSAKDRMPIFVFNHGTCSPTAPIDKYARVGAGLKNSGRIDGSCVPLDQDRYNIFTQVKAFGDYYVSMWGLYFPKDGTINGWGGHRHDWENVYIWYKLGDEQEYLPKYVSYVQHGGWYTGSWERIPHDGIRPIVYVGKAKHGMYHNPNNGAGGLADLLYWHDTRARFENGYFFPQIATEKQEGVHRLVDFDRLDDHVKSVLKGHHWGSANSPMRDDIWDKVRYEMYPKIRDGQWRQVCAKSGCSGQSAELR